MEELEREVSRLRQENEDLRIQLKKRPLSSSEEESEENDSKKSCLQQNYRSSPPLPSVEKLSPNQIERYSRQLLLQGGFGVSGQRALLSSSVLVIGAGGIGSTALLYLAAAGLGRISILDFDTVERSNLHRQIIHKDENVGVNKAVSACRAMVALNPSMQGHVHPLPFMLTHENALEMVRDHDCIVDASDNPRTRYLINDACILAGKPLISGSAIGSEGQLSVFNWKGGPCYRCLYPKPSITAGAKSCSDAGVLGPVPGLIGILQALEVLKVLTGTGNPMNERLLMYDSLQCSFLNIKKPKKQSTCPVCSGPPNAAILTMEDSDKDLELARGPASCTMNMPSKLEDRYQITCTEYNNLRKNKQAHILLDVRVKEQYDLCALDKAVNVPLEKLQESMDQIEEISNNWNTPIFCICRRGIASVEATKILTDALASKRQGNGDAGDVPLVKNIKGGLDSWREHVDETFPKY